MSRILCNFTCKAPMRNVRVLCMNNKTFTHLKDTIIKGNHIDKMLISTTKINTAKKNLYRYSATIERIESCNDTIISDLADLSNYISSSYTTPESRIYIRSTIYKYLDEFKNDPDVLEMFYYILYYYTYK